MLQKLNIENNGFDRLVKAMENSEPVAKPEPKQDYKFEKIIEKFNSKLLLPVPSIPTVLHGDTGTGKTLILRYWAEILGKESAFVYEPDLINDFGTFDFRFANIENWLYKKYIILDEILNLCSHKSMSQRAHTNYLSFLEKLIYRHHAPIILASTNSINFSILPKKIERRWRDILCIDGKIKTLEIKK